MSCYANASDISRSHCRKFLQRKVALFLHHQALLKALDSEVKASYDMHIINNLDPKGWGILKIKFSLRQILIDNSIRTGLLS